MPVGLCPGWWACKPDDGVRGRSGLRSAGWIYHDRLRNEFTLMSSPCFGGAATGSNRRRCVTSIGDIAVSAMAETPALPCFDHERLRLGMRRAPGTACELALAPMSVACRATHTLLSVPAPSICAASRRKRDLKREMKNAARLATSSYGTCNRTYEHAHRPYFGAWRPPTRSVLRSQPAIGAQHRAHSQPLPAPFSGSAGDLPVRRSACVRASVSQSEKDTHERVQTTGGNE